MHEPRPERAERTPAVHEPRSERIEPVAPVHEPAAPRAQESAPETERVRYGEPLAPPSFRSVSQHDEAEDAPHHPNRRRRQTPAEAAAQQQALQLVETQIEAPVISTHEDDLPRRTKPRRRRAGAKDSEPLQLVETESTPETQHPDSSRTP
jgi:hypothetical protein